MEIPFYYRNVILSKTLSNNLWLDSTMHFSKRLAVLREIYYVIMGKCNRLTTPEKRGLSPFSYAENLASSNFAYSFLNHELESFSSFFFFSLFLLGLWVAPRRWKVSALELELVCSGWWDCCCDETSNTDVFPVERHFTIHFIFPFWYLSKKKKNPLASLSKPI